MAVSTPASKVLDLLFIKYRFFEHHHSPESLEKAANERGQTPEQIVRSILFRFQKDQYFLTLVAGPGQIAWRKLRSYLTVSRISLATEEEVLAVTGYAVGTVSPLGIPNPIRILTDYNVFIPDEISVGSGVRRLAIILASADLRRALGKIECGHFC